MVVHGEQDDYDEHIFLGLFRKHLSGHSVLSSSF